jgi:hypothetical protein
VTVPSRERSRAFGAHRTVERCETPAGRTDR